MPSRDFVTLAAACNETTSFRRVRGSGRYVALWHFSDSRRGRTWVCNAFQSEVDQPMFNGPSLMF
jgi:hypothetical protein